MTLGRNDAARSLRPWMAIRCRRLRHGVGVRLLDLINRGPDIEDGHRARLIREFAAHLADQTEDIPETEAVPSDLRVRETNLIPGRAVGPLHRGAEDAVLRRVLDLHPANLAERELTLLLVGDALALRCETFRVAIEALVADGLLRREEGSIHPTRAALRAEEVER
jgi:hypothetical protein